MAMTGFRSFIVLRALDLFTGTFNALSSNLKKAEAAVTTANKAAGDSTHAAIAAQAKYAPLYRRTSARIKKLSEDLRMYSMVVRHTRGEEKQRALELMGYAAGEMARLTRLQQTTRAERDAAYATAQRDRAAAAANQTTARSAKTLMSLYNVSHGLSVFYMMAMGQLTQFAQKTSTAFKNLIQPLERIAMVVDMNREQFGDLKAELLDLSVAYGKAVRDVGEAAYNWARITKDSAEIQRLTNDSLLFSIVTMQNAGAASEQLRRIMVQFNIDFADSITIIDKLNEVTNNYGTTADYLSKVLADLGAISVQVGVSMDQLIGYATSLSEVGYSAGETTSLLRIIFARFTEQGDRVSKAFAKIGIEIRKEDNTMRDFNDVINDLSLAWGDLDEAQRHSVSNVLVGNRQYAKFVSLLEHLDRAAEAAKTSIDSLGSATEEMSDYTDTWTYRQEKLNAVTEQANALLGEAMYPQMLAIQEGMAHLYTQIGKTGGAFKGLIATVMVGSKEFGNLSMMLMWMSTSLRNMKAAMFMNALAITLMLIPGLSSADKTTRMATAAVMGMVWALYTLKTIMKMGWMAAFALSAGFAVITAAIAGAQDQTEETFGGSPGGQMERSFNHALRVTKEFARDYTSEMESMGLTGDVLSPFAPEISPTTNIISGPITVTIEKDDDEGTAEKMADSLILELKLRGINL